MNNFIFHSPTEFVFGKETEMNTGALCRKYGATKVLLLYGGGSAIRSGLIDRVRRSLEESGMPFAEMGGIQPNPVAEKVYEGIRLCRESGADFLLPVGGGSVIDTAKAIAVGSCYKGDFWDLYIRKGKAAQALKVGVVLTIPAAGSEGSASTVITNEKTKQKIGLTLPELLRPAFAVMNPELTYSLPLYQTSCGVADMMAHIMERYFTNTQHVEVTDGLCESLLRTIIAEARKCMDIPHSYSVRANLMWAGMIAHNGIMGVGREEDWSSHAMEHEVSALYNVAHGAGLAVIFPAWLTWMADHNLPRVAQFAHRVFDVPESGNDRSDALKGVELLKEFFRGIGLPVNFKELGVEQPDIQKMVAGLRHNYGEYLGHFVPLNADSMREIYNLANLS